LSQLIAINFDMVSSPYITTNELTLPTPETSLSIGTFGWGLAWYPPEDRGVAVLKDPSRATNNHMKEMLAQWEHFRSNIFLGHLRGAAMRIAHEDTHPITRPYAGRDFVIVHNGQLDDDFRDKLDLSTYPEFQPVGMTDTEHVLCWILMKMRQEGVSTFEEMGHAKLHGLLQEVDNIGSLNVMLSDGVDLIVHQDQQGFHPLHYARKIPPHENDLMESEELNIKLMSAQDYNSSVIMFASNPTKTKGWDMMSSGQTLICRKSQIIWNSHFNQPADIPPPKPKYRHERPVYRIFHETSYQYSEPILRSQHILRMCPMTDARQSLIDWKLECYPLGLQVDYDDVFGNRVRRIDYSEPFTEMLTRLTTVVRVEQDVNEALHTPSRRNNLPLNWMPWQRQVMMAYLMPTEMPEPQLSEMYEFARSIMVRNNSDLVETLLDINRIIYNDFDYVPGSTNVDTSAYEVFCTRKGVCQDFANIMIIMARLLGVPARYRMGYIFTNADYKNQIQSDASHAWAECYLPQYGWCGFDPTNGCLANFDHIRVSSGRNFRDSTPTSGTIYQGGGTETLGVQVKVERIE
jgi:transglutaminase-like putative cysteine protease/predicted glutamine amidotransferase